MKAIFIAILASFVALATADCGFPQGVCLHLEATSNALAKAVEDSNDALADAITDAAQKTATLYQASLNILKTSALSPDVKNIDDVIQLEEKLSATLKEAQASQNEVVQEAYQAFQDASKEISELLMETVVIAKDPESDVADDLAFSFAGEGLEAMKKQLQEALKLAKGKLKTIIKKALDKLTGGLKKLEGFLGKILGQAGVKKVRELLQMQVDRILKALAEALSKKVSESSKPTFSLAVVEAESFLDELDGDAKYVKRGFKDIWGKIKSAAAKLGSSIRDAAVKALNKHKPLILQKLKELGKAIINAGKELIIEIVNGAVRIVPAY